MTVPNLFCQRVARGEVLQVLEDRPMAFIHVADAAEALVCASEQQAEEWQAFNAATQVATVGEVARTVQQLMRERGDSVRVVGASSEKSDFEVRSTLNLRPRFRLETGLEAVLEHFRATR
jgi:nucleoside-diphosphate-sugar epimerase